MYWAFAYHYGRKEARPKGERLVWFADPRQDPRNSGGYPTRSKPRKLTAAEVRKFVEINRRVISEYRRQVKRPLVKADYDDLYRRKKLPIIFAKKSSKPSAENVHPFFSTDPGSVISDSIPEIRKLMSAAYKKYVIARVRGSLNK